MPFVLSCVIEILMVTFLHRHVTSTSVSELLQKESLDGPSKTLKSLIHRLCRVFRNDALRSAARLKMAVSGGLDFLLPDWLHRVFSYLRAEGSTSIKSLSVVLFYDVLGMTRRQL